MGSILVYKIKHGLDLHSMLASLTQIVDRALLLGNCSSTYFKDFNVPSKIASSTARKYLKTKTLKSAKRIKGIINNQVFRVDSKMEVIKIRSLKCSVNLPYTGRKIIKVNQIEFDSLYFYVSCSVESSELIKVTTTLGVDFNTKGNTCFVALKEKGLAFPLGLSQRDFNQNCVKRTSKLKSNSKFNLSNKIDRKRTRRVNDNIHKVSREIVDLAIKHSSCIVLEDLKGIRNSKCKKEFGKSNWRFHDLKLKIEYKANLAGIPVHFINPRNTSKMCSKCGHIKENLSGKTYHCSECGYNSHRDLNAAFNIANKFLVESASKELDLEVGCLAYQSE